MKHLCPHTFFLMLMDNAGESFVKLACIAALGTQQLAIRKIRGRVQRIAVAHGTQSHAAAAAAAVAASGGHKYVIAARFTAYGHQLLVEFYKDRSVMRLSQQHLLPPHLLVPRSWGKQE